VARNIQPLMLHPSPEQLAPLSRMERAAFRLCHEVNNRPLLKSSAHAWLKHIGCGWVHYCSRNLSYAYELNHLRSLNPDRGVVVVANHRSFFDLYVLTNTILRSTTWVKQMYFPVRSSYFYDRPDGVVVNALMSALAMYPPIMRAPSKRDFNKFSVEQLAQIAGHKGCLVGIHPEGTRSKTDDPYTLLPGQPGVGQIIHHARPIVIPAFILGLCNSFPEQVARNFNGKGEPITMLFGPPVNLDTLLNSPPKLRTYKQISDKLCEVLTALGQKEKQIRVENGFPSKSPPSISSARQTAA
jgi:1-acyl-sn-glycerol-3-phosphate acyltransferase